MQIAARYSTTLRRRNVPAVEYEFRYLKMRVTANRTDLGILQLSEIELYKNAAGTITTFAWPAEATVTAAFLDGSSVSYSNDEGPQNLIDGSVNTKFCCGYTQGQTLDITIDLCVGNSVDVSVYAFWKWYSANDYPGRNPEEFVFMASNDGANWVVLDDYAANGNITIWNSSDLRSVQYVGFIGASVEYLRAGENNNWIDTGLIPNTNYSYEITYRPVGDFVEWGAVFGTYQTDSRYLNVILRNYGASDNMSCWFNSSDDPGPYEIDPSVFTKVELSRGSITWQSGSSVSNSASFSVSSQSMTSSYHILLFGASYRSESTPWASRRQECMISAFKAYDNISNLVMDAIPVRLVANGVRRGGMFDRISGTMLTEGGSATVPFIIGSDNGRKGLNADGTLTFVGTLDSDGTITYDGTLNSDGTVSILV